MYLDVNTETYAGGVIKNVEIVFVRNDMSKKNVKDFVEGYTSGSSVSSR